MTHRDETRDGQTVRIWTASFRAANDGSAAVPGLTSAATRTEALDHGALKLWTGTGYQVGQQVEHDGQDFWLVQTDNSLGGSTAVADPFNGGVSRWNTGENGLPSVSSWLRDGADFRIGPYLSGPYGWMWESVGFSVTLHAPVPQYNHWVRANFPNNPEWLIDADAHSTVYLETTRLENDPRPDWQDPGAYEPEWRNNPRLTWRLFVEQAAPSFTGAAFEWSAEYVETLRPSVDALEPVTPEVEVILPEVVTPITPEVEVELPTVVTPVTPEVEVELPTVVAPVTPEVEVVLPGVVTPNTPEVVVELPTVVAPVTPEVEVELPTVLAPVIPEVEVELPTVVAPVMPEIEMERPNLDNLGTLTPVVNPALPTVVTPLTPVVNPVLNPAVTPATAQPVLSATGADQLPLILAAALSAGGVVTALASRRTRQAEA